MTRLARLIAQREGFFKPGTRPARDHNPGDLRHAPHATGFDDARIAVEPSDTAGWADLEHQLALYAQRGLTLRQAIAVYAPTNENNTDSYLEFVCGGLGLPPEALVSDALKVSA